jgi:very-short-patch-repair endonuclease
LRSVAVTSEGVQLLVVDSFASRHHGLISRPAAERLGISRAAWYRAISSDQLEQLYPNVARVHGSPSTFEQRGLAAVWATGPDAMTSHRTSASLWDVERPEDDPLDVMIASRRRHSLPQGVIIHRPRDLLDLRPVIRRGVPTTNPMRMLLDLGAVDPEAVFDAMITVLSTKAASPSALRSALVRHSRRGRRGTAAFRQALERWLGEELPPDSALEGVMSDLIRSYDLPPMQFHAMVAGYEVDFRVRGTNIVIECDGWAAHGLDRDQFEFDRIRDADLVAAGFVTAHVTWRQLTNQPAKAAERIKRVVATWSADGSAQ